MIDIKFGDILKYSDEWFKASGKRLSNKRFVATGKIECEAPNEIISVVAEGRGYCEKYLNTFLEKVKD